MSRPERYEKLLQTLLKGGRIILSPWRLEAEGPLGIMTVFILALIALLTLVSASPWGERLAYSSAAMSKLSSNSRRPADKLECVAPPLSPGRARDRILCRP